MSPAQGEVYSVAVVIAEPAAFPDMRRGLLPTFAPPSRIQNKPSRRRSKIPAFNRFCLIWTASAKARAMVWSAARDPRDS